VQKSGKEAAGPSLSAPLALDACLFLKQTLPRPDALFSTSGLDSLGCSSVSGQGKIIPSRIATDRFGAGPNAAIYNRFSWFLLLSSSKFAIY